MTWLAFCEHDPGPDWKTGYGDFKSTTLDDIEGVVDHSMEGTMAGARTVLRGPSQASWTFSLPKVGRPHQHYPLEVITWHAGLPGDRRHDTSLIGNITLRGKEHEGVAGDPWTQNQIRWSAEIDVAMRKVCPRFAANPPTLKLNEWEHRWLSATSCPSGRNPWAAKFALILEMEGDMLVVKFSDQSGALYIPAGGVLIQVASTAAWNGMRELGYEVRDIKPNEPNPGLRSIRNWPKMGANDLLKSGGYSDAQAVKAVKAKL